MKCQQCEKPATFHITELTSPGVEELHLCEDCARIYLMQSNEEETPTIAGALAQQLKVTETAEDLARLDQKICPVCGISFYEFRQLGRLGCPNDYLHFEEELEPLIVNIHGETKHKGKHPKSGKETTDRQTDLIRLRRDMQDAVDLEDYERASEIRDEIRGIESGESPSEDNESAE